MGGYMGTLYCLIDVSISLNCFKKYNNLLYLINLIQNYLLIIKAN